MIAYGWIDRCRGSGRSLKDNFKVQVWENLGTINTNKELRRGNTVFEGKDKFSFLT